VVEVSFFSDSSALYLYSALLQANAAILSLFAIFVIFRIQSLASSIDTRKFVLGSDLGRHVAAADINSFEIMSIQDKKSYIDCRQGKGIPILAHFEAWVSYEEKIEHLKHTIITPCTTLAGSILFFAFAVSIANFVHRLSVIGEAILMAFSILLEALCLGLVLRASFSLIGIGPRIEKLSRTEKAILSVIKVKK
jgi:hypothetical protein